MNYELAKELKDAGFPQREGVKLLRLDMKAERVVPYDGYTGYGCGVLYEGETPGVHDTYAPTLSELIEACGDDFRDLVYHSKRTEESTYRKWASKGGRHTLGHWTLKNGHTPEEAVAKLWLALKKDSAAL